MAKFKVRKTLLIECAIDLIVEAENAEDADDIACGCTPSNVGIDYREAGWRAKVEVVPPKNVAVITRKAKTTWMDTASGNEGKPRRMAETTG